MNYLQFENIIKPLFFNELNYSLSAIQIEKYFDFMNYLIDENTRVNLTSIVDPVQIIYKHFLDSCQLIKFYDSKDPHKRFIDIGCGAGFPSIPLSILYPESLFLLVDSVSKKLKFIEKVVSKLKLDNVVTSHARIEDLGHDKSFVEKFDCCVSRALSKIPVVLEYSSAFLRINGYIYIYKMLNSVDEMKLSSNAQSILKLIPKKCIEYHLFANEPARIIYSFVKLQSTPDTYPRKPGLPTKFPL